jgi:hypothetical protein
MKVLVDALMGNATVRQVMIDAVTAHEDGNDTDFLAGPATAPAGSATAPTGSATAPTGRAFFDEVEESVRTIVGAFDNGAVWSAFNQSEMLVPFVCRGAAKKNPSAPLAIRQQSAARWNALSDEAKGRSLAKAIGEYKRSSSQETRRQVLDAFAGIVVRWDLIDSNGTILSDVAANAKRQAVNAARLSASSGK